jgi:DNA invertase Pin-like site-specific DNA recombinase
MIQMRYGYIRTSTESQNLARQQQTMKEYDVEPEEIFADQLSGKNTERPEFQKMLNTVHKGDVLVVSSLDRLSRDYNDLKNVIKQLHDKQVRLEVADMEMLNLQTGNDLMDEFLFDTIVGLLSFVAQNEREKILERTRQGIAKAKERGKYKGRAAKYRADAPNPANKLMYEKIVDMLENDEPVSKVAEFAKISRPAIYRIKADIEQN